MIPCLGHAHLRMALQPISNYINIEMIGHDADSKVLYISTPHHEVANHHLFGPGLCRSRAACEYRRVHLCSRGACSMR